MEGFFNKYPPSPKLNEGMAIKTIYKKIKCAKKSYKEDKTSNKYLKELAMAYAMLDCFFEEKGIDPQTLL